MLTLIRKHVPCQLTQKTRLLLFELICYGFIGLFTYTATDKVMTVKNFASTLAKSPLIGQFSTFIAWGIPVLEISIAILLILPKYSRTGLRASLALMLLFTVYLAHMVFSGSKLPCHCGGVISILSWPQHIWFNLGWVALAAIGIRLTK